jgi:flagellar motor switch protein FliM
MPIEDRDIATTAPWLQTSQSDLSIERMPGLGFAIEQFALNISEALAPLYKASWSGTIDEIKSTTVFQLVGQSEGLTAAVLRCTGTDTRLLLIFDQQVVGALVAAVFGGEQGAVAPTPANRPPTGIETSLLAELARCLGKALDKGFAQIASLALSFERLETLEDAYALGRRDMPAAVAKLAIETSAGSTTLTVLLPQTLLLPIRKNLSFDPGGDALASDPRWKQQMEARVTKTRVTVTAVLDVFEMTLGDIADLAIGQVLNLHGAGMGRVRLECAGREMFWCKLGDGDGRYALEVEEGIEPESDIVAAASIH